jgi:hypothetical protein
LVSLLRRAAAWSQNPAARLKSNLFRRLVFLVSGVTVRELACLRLLHERLPNKTAMHLRVFEFMLRNGSHFTAQEIAEATGTYQKFAELILQELAENRLIEKEGCLYRCNGIAIEEILACE